MLGSEFRKAIESADHAAAVATLSPDVILHSPVTFKPFVGKEAVAHLFSILLEVFEDFSYSDHIEGDGIALLIFHARVGDRDVEGIDILRFGDDGLIADFTVMVRPMSATIALAEAVGSRLGVTR